MSVIFAAKDDVTASAQVINIHVLRPSGWDEFKATLNTVQQNFATARQFSGKAGQMLHLPSANGDIETVLYGAGYAEADTLGAMRAGGLSGSLPAGYYRFAGLPNDWNRVQAHVGWGVGAYKFETYLSNETDFPTLIIEDADRLNETRSLVEATHLCRDLINTPASDMGPIALHKAAEDLGKDYGADVAVTIGEDLLKNNFPMIHAVGRAAHEAPRLVEFEWGDPCLLYTSDAADE